MAPDFQSSCLSLWRAGAMQQSIIMPSLDIFFISYPNPLAIQSSLSPSKKRYLYKQMPRIINIPSLIIIALLCLPAAVMKYWPKEILGRRGFIGKAEQVLETDRNWSRDHGGTVLTGLHPRRILSYSSYTAQALLSKNGTGLSGPGIHINSNQGNRPQNLTALLSRCVRLSIKVSHHSILMNEGFDGHFLWALFMPTKHAFLCFA